MAQFTLQNELLLEVNLQNATLYAKKGSMLACSGDIRYARSFLTGGGIQQLAARQVTDETMQMMSATGTGSVFCAHDRRHVHIVPLMGKSLYVESDQVLCFEHGIIARPVFIGQNGLAQGLIRGAVSDQGLFTTALSGKGSVAILSDGACIALDVHPNNPIAVDPDAYIGHQGELQSSFVTDVNWKTLIGQASGESYQIKFSGQGTVFIQGSERR